MVAFTLYQTSTKLYAIRHDSGGSDGEECWRVLKLDRSSATLEAAEDTHPYTRPQIQRLLASIHAGNQGHGGLQLVCEAHALLGTVQFLEGPYLLLCTRRRHLGTICGHKVYGIDATALLPVLTPAAHRALFGSSHAATAEVRYRKLLAGVQLTKDFFFSHTWPVHQTAQRTFGQAPEEWSADGDGANRADSSSSPSSTWGSARVWNDFLARPLRDALGGGGACHRWVVPISHGFFEQRPLALLGRPLTLTLIARRSRLFAGTRYLKRGVTGAGCAANDVEVEQVVEAGLDWKSGRPLLASVVQVRGSIPLHWAQRPDSSMLKPEIVLHRFDPLYAATRRHFDSLRQQYGDPVCVLDLVKRVERRPRESLLGQEYAQAVRFINAHLEQGEQRVQYTAFDLSHKAKVAKKQLLSDLQRLQEPVLAATGIFVSCASGSTAASHGSTRGGRGCRAAPAVRQQSGVLRTNCIDSLDRTNVAQFTYGMLGLGQQLHALGIAETAWLDPASSLARHLMDGYERMGHTLALQYGGSEAHTTFFQRQRGDWEAATQSRDLLTTVRRFYSNAWTDAEKQDALNVFLGSFRPAHGKPHIWELGSDAYLHAAPGRAPGRTTSLGGSRSSSFSAASGGHAGLAAAAAAAAAGAEHLASFPPPVSPPRPSPPLRGRLGSPPEEGREASPPELVESLSAASLVSLSSDGSFAPPLSSLMEGASSQPLSHLLSASISKEQEEAEETAAGGSSSSDHPATPLASTPIGAAAGAAAFGSVTSGSRSPSPGPSGARPGPSQPARAGPRRSPLLGRTRKPAKLESLDKILSRQPVAHVRLTAAPPPSKSALGWLSPGKSAQQPAAADRKGAAAKPSAAAAAAAKATVAAAGVGSAAPGVPIPGGGLRRSNSDPNLSCSLQAAAPIAAAAAAGLKGLPPAPRRVTFDTVAPPGPRTSTPCAAGSSGGGGSGGGGSVGPLLRQSTAPTSSLDQWGSSGLGSGSCGGLGPVFGSSLPGQLLLVEGSGPGGLPLGGGSGMGSQRHGSGSYHALAGLNLEGAAAAEASIKPGSTVPAAAPLPKAPSRRLSFPNFARLRGALARKSFLDGGSSGSGLQAAAVGVGRSATDPAPGEASLLQPSPSLLGPRMGAYGSGGGSGGSGALGPEPLSMSAVVYGAEAVRRGIDTLGVVAPASASWWLTGADPLAAMMEERQRLHAQVVSQREALATPLDPVELRALREQYAALARPSWALSLGAFTQGAVPAVQPPVQTAASQASAAAHPVPPPGLAF